MLLRYLKAIGGAGPHRKALEIHEKTGNLTKGFKEQLSFMCMQDHL
jgi:hypothetical protein